MDVFVFRKHAVVELRHVKGFKLCRRATAVEVSLENICMSAKRSKLRFEIMLKNRKNVRRAVTTEKTDLIMQGSESVEHLDMSIDAGRTRINAEPSGG